MDADAPPLARAASLCLGILSHTGFVTWDALIDAATAEEPRGDDILRLKKLSTIDLNSYENDLFAHFEPLLRKLSTTPKVHMSVCPVCGPPGPYRLVQPTSEVGADEAVAVGPAVTVDDVHAVVEAAEVTARAVGPSTGQNAPGQNALGAVQDRWAGRPRPTRRASEEESGDDWLNADLSGLDDLLDGLLVETGEKPSAPARTEVDPMALVRPAAEAAEVEGQTATQGPAAVAVPEAKDPYEGFEKVDVTSLYDEDGSFRIGRGWIFTAGEAIKKCMTTRGCAGVPVKAGAASKTTETFEIPDVEVAPAA